MCRQILRRIILNYIFVLCFQITSLNPSCSSVESDTYLFYHVLHSGGSTEAAWSSQPWRMTEVSSWSPTLHSSNISLPPLSALFTNMLDMRTSVGHLSPSPNQHKPLRNKCEYLIGSPSYKENGTVISLTSSELQPKKVLLPYNRSFEGNLRSK